MKRILSIVLAVLTVASVFAFASCADTAETTLKMGLGVYSAASKASNAEGETKGVGQVAITAAAVLVDADGKVVKCVIDTADNKAEYTSDGKAVASDSFKTKYELGKDYNMVAYGGATKEWYEQADAFAALVVGKTASEIKALVAESKKGTDEVINAGCTITIEEFVLAVDKAIANATDSAATASSTLKLGMYTELTGKDATADKVGENKLETTVFAAALGADGKIAVASSDCVQVAFTFDTKGASTYDLTAKIESKKDKGAAYGMSQWGTDLNGDGTVKEWIDQAAAFNAACAGKTVAEVKALMADNNYGVADLQSAGCTILVSGFVKAAEKIG